MSNRCPRCPSMIINGACMDCGYKVPQKPKIEWTNVQMVCTLNGHKYHVSKTGSDFFHLRKQKETAPFVYNKLQVYCETGWQNEVGPDVSNVHRFRLFSTLEEVEATILADVL